MNSFWRNILSRIGFRATLVGAFSLLSFLIIVILFVVINTLVKDTMFSHERKHTISSTRIISEAFSELMARNDIAGVDNLVSEILRQDEVIYLNVYDESGKLLSENVDNDEVLTIAERRSGISIVQLDTIEVTYLKNRYYDVVNPVYRSGVKIGAVRLGIDLTQLKQRIDRQRNYYVLTLIGALLLTILFSIVVGRILDVPIKQLVRHTHQVANGNLTGEVRINAISEFAILADAFNSMTSRLDESQTQIRSYQRTLEHRIVEQNSNLYESEEKYRNLVEASHDIILIVQEEKIRFCNSRIEEMFGIGAEDTFGESIDQIDIFDPAALNQLRTIMTNPESNGNPYQSVELNLFNKDGREFIVEAVLLPIQFNKKPAVQIVLRDITQRKKIESELLQIQKLESIGRMAGGIAHDFNNIIGVILPNAELIMEMSNTNEPIYTQAEQIESAATRASELTSKLLSFSRREELQLRALDTNTLIQNVLNLTGRVFPRNIIVHTQLATRLPNIKADRIQIEQVVLNIMLNARDAMPNGGSILVKSSLAGQRDLKEVPLPVIPSGTRYILISFRDTGIGMDAETQKKIFEPFFTTKAEAQGTGLGLSVVYGIVQEHGGFISVNSKPGHGTRFSVFLPATTEKVTDETTTTREVETGEGTILVVEDEPMMLDTVNNLLLHLGYQVIPASDGKKALEVLKNRADEINMILLDMEMPGMNGLETMREIQKINAGIPIVISSGYAKEGKVEQALAEGAIDYLKKPYRLLDLGQKLKEISVRLATPE